MNTPAIKRIQQHILDKDKEGVEKDLGKLDDDDLMCVMQWVWQDKTRWANELVLMVAQSVQDHNFETNKWVGHSFMVACAKGGLEEVTRWCDFFVEWDGEHFAFKQSGMMMAISHDQMDTVQYLLDRFAWDAFEGLLIKSGLFNSQSPKMFDLLMARAPDQDTKLYLFQQLCLYGLEFPLSDLTMVDAVMGHFDISEIRQVRLQVEMDERAHPSSEENEFKSMRQEFFQLVEACHTQHAIVDEVGSAGHTHNKTLKM